MSPATGAGRGRSAFAAAFFSAIFPGLGHAYLGRWVRALAWAALPVLMIALVAGYLVNSETRNHFVAQFTSPSWLLGTLAALVFDFLYRAAAALDAYRIARAESPGVSPPALRALSVAGLAAIMLVLALSHVAAARPVYLTYDLITSLGQGDDEPIIDPEETLPPGFETPPPIPTEAPAPTGEPTQQPEPTATPMPTPTRGPDWNGTERLNILLIGADRRESGQSNFLTDTMIVASIDPVTKRLALITLPRDTADVPLPRDWPAYSRYGGKYGSKINTLYTIARLSPSLFPGDDRQRGYIALKGALSELYQLDVKYYVMVDLNGFRTIIDQLGGLIIDVQVPVADDHYGAEDGRGHLNLYIPAGIRHMNGAEALAYARARHQTSDFDRAARQQHVLVALRQQTDLSTLLAPGVLERLFTTFKKSIRTDIPPELFPQLVSLAQEVDIERRVSLILQPPTYATVCYPCPPDGLYELTANVPAIRRAVKNVFDTNREEEKRRADLAAEAAVVHVLNGTTDTRKATLVADYLASTGVDAVVPPVNGGRADSTTYRATVVTVYNGAEIDIPETVAWLEEVFGVTAVTAIDETQTAQVVVVVGSATPELSPPPE